MKLRRALGRELRARRAAAQLSLDDLAQRVGTQAPGVSRLERGEGGWCADTLEKYADALGVRVSDFVEAAEQRQDRHRDRRALIEALQERRGSA